MMLVSVITPDRRTIETCLILVMQHWFVRVRHANRLGYALTEWFSEVWFECLISISGLQQYYLANHWTAATMLVAHWPSTYWQQLLIACVH
jgi:hypothetical protein